ncbi:uncharacterized protein LOC111026816 [Myzus persicae]|uniref:uncharacterized protein LOC111026816 n=1 Tax=Myzus persicae TaxID=13164 RepID=UPI000B935857|nr:uncharacterized protein LOC111026816 [Myzus persicae]
MLLWAKSFMQQLWQQSVDWDTPLPSNLSIIWHQFLAELPSLSRIALIRHIDTRDYRDVQLIGFADASQLGYAATVYIRVVSSSERVQVHFLTGKTKVAPLKNSDTDMTLTIPRLELCATLLLAQLLHCLHMKLSPTVSISKIQAWTDSSVVLLWLTTDQKSFKIFVTNRVAKIHLLVPNCVWSHVSTIENPADPSSRGLLPEALISCALHWNGPSFLRLPEHQWPKSKFSVIPVHHLPDVKPAVAAVNLVQKGPQADCFLRRFSSFNQLQRVLVYVLRYIYRVIMKRSTIVGVITFAERQRAVLVAIRITQRVHFPVLFKQLANPERLVTPSTLAQLAPFIDVLGIIRVGGRLQSSWLTEEAKHPSLLPKSSHLTALIINHYHLTFLHAGPKLVISMLRQRFWIMSGRDSVRRMIFSCLPCTRHKAQNPIPSMGRLLESRVQPHRVFSKVGLDFGGPFLVKERKRRNIRTTKVYISVFICMAVKAIHVEVVSDLTTEAFLAALDRFVSRRGLPTDLYSYCGTNYVGAARQLQTLLADNEVQNRLSSRIECNWHFNPPAAPHFGGLWEAAIKSIKFHLKLVIGTQILTYEEFQTVVTRVEGVLNSRPLTPASTDPHDLDALTPGHFLIGQPLSSIPEKDVTSVPLNRLTRWQLLRQLHQSFWKRWQREYLTTLQARQKWTKVSDNLAVGDVVIIDAPNQPPYVWRMGRVIAVHPGPDQIVRVVTLKTQDGEMQRPVVKLVKLPVDTTTS